MENLCTFFGFHHFVYTFCIYLLQGLLRLYTYTPNYSILMVHANKLCLQNITLREGKEGMSECNAALHGVRRRICMVIVY